MAGTAPFFIVGSGRSGTTMLRLMLAAHSRIEIPPETGFMEPLARALPLTSPLSPAEVERAVALMVGDYRWPDMEMPAEQLGAAARALASPCLRDLAGIVYAEFLRRAGKVRWGDKTPPYIAIVPALAEIYPDARFIYVIRDGRDVATSYIDAGFPGAFWHPEFEWKRAVRAFARLRAGRLAPRLLEVRYEEMVRDVETTIRRICDFIGERFEPPMMRFRGSIAEKVPARERHAHNSLAEPIGAHAATRWRSRLGTVELFAIESCMYPELLAADYALRFAGSGWRPALAAAGFVLQRIGPAVRRVARALHNRGLMRRQVYIWRNYERNAAG